ncbi:MAG TPA: flagellar basal-body rod protein FlgF [Candidatus Latescibacteria bacterium]|nr:flagellar basal-body rod protein FlgF [Candidatus Latescibacterota bacterium]
MIRGIYTSASGMLARELAQEVLANNIANVKTTGFKRDKVYFQGALDGISSAEGVLKVATDYREGPLIRTDNPLDLAIQGRGFFAVETPWGIRYTRDGHFSVNEEGVLVTTDGHPVLGEEGSIELDLSGGPPSVGEDGTVRVGDVVVGQLRIEDFEDLDSLRKEGNGLFRAYAEGRPAEGFRVRQGFLEGANVSPVEEMVRMLANYRAYEAGQRAIVAQDEALRKAVNEVGRYRG